LHFQLCTLSLPMATLNNATAKGKSKKFYGEGLTFDDVLLMPAYSQILPREVNISTQPSADIFIDGKFIAAGSYQGKVPAGVSTFEARKEGYYPEKIDKDIAVGESVTINLTVQPKLGSVDIISNPMEAKVILNGEEKGITPVTLQNLLVGNYELKLEKKGFASKIVTIAISENKTTEVNEKLAVGEGKAVVSASTLANQPIYNTDYYKYKKSKTIWLISAIASAGVGTFAYLQSKNYYEQYQNATTDAESLYKKVQMYNLISPIAFAAAGFCAVEVVLTSKKQGKAKQQSLGFNPQPLNHGAALNLVYKF